MNSILNLSRAVKIVTALDYVDGNADRNGAGLDMSGYESVLMVVKFAAIAAGATTSIKAQQSNDNGVADDYSDIAGTGIAVAADDDNQIFYLDIVRPQKRYVRLVVDKDAANNCAESAIYFQYGARVEPVNNNVTDKVTGEIHVSKDEGTA